MQLYKRPAHSYRSMYNRMHIVELYEAELPDNVGEWVEQTAGRWYDDAAEIFNSAISGIMGGVEIGTSTMASGDRITDSAKVITPTKVSTTDDSVKTTTVLLGIQINGYGVSFNREISQAIPDTTSGN